MKRVINLILCVFSLLLLLTGCQKKDDTDENGTHVYYINITATDLVKESYDGDTEYGEAAVDAMLEILNNPEDMEDYQSPLPKNVEISSYLLEDDRLTLYFGQSYNKMDNVREVLLRSAVVQSLTEIDGINWVAFYIGEEPLKDSSGNQYGWMRGEDFVQNTGSAINSYQEATLVLYFANETGDKLVTESRTIRHNSNTAMEKVIVEQILKGPSGEGHYPTIGSDAKLLNISVKDNICYVNFDEGVQLNAYDLIPEVAMYSIVNSLVSNGIAEQVQISVNGDTTVKFQGVLSLEKPFPVNEELVSE
ncbi:MAG: GerMN domain-containing protein [Lachnospiraceae bacterium]